MNRPNKRRSQMRNSKARDQCQPTGSCRFHQLPQALVMDILSRLSPNNLLTCRCVCKPWLVMISDPFFNRLPHSRSPIGILIQTYPHVYHWRLRKLYFTHIVEESAGPDLQLERMTFRPKISIPLAADKYYFLDKRCGLINSCNGLLLLAGPNNRKPLFVCNPITGEFITTRPLPDRAKDSVVGLGFSAATNEYKVLATCKYYRVQIYTIGTRVWKDIGEPPIRHVELQFNASLHGALHWICDRDWIKVDDLMQSFNFETEKFEIVPPPGRFAVLAPVDKLRRCSLGVLEGCLLLSGFCCDTAKYEMWIMRDYGVQESWTKTLVIESMYPRLPINDPYRHGEEYRPIMFLSNGEILMYYVTKDIGAVVCYNPETKRYRTTSIALTKSAFFATGYSPSFVSLHNIAKGEEVNRIRNNENFNKLFTDGSGSGTSAVQATNLNPDTCPPGIEEAPVTPNVTTSSASQ